MHYSNCHPLEVHSESMTVPCRKEADRFVQGNQVRHSAVGYQGNLAETELLGHIVFKKNVLRKITK